jgi:two-component system, chemotaxis family, protein-glutamate methylesterase/glutaminase
MRPPELVAVGTSLGGLNALTALIGALPDRFPVPVVIVQHRSISSDGRGLARLLQEHARMSVVEAEDKMALEPGTVYLAPADYHLLIEEPGMLALSTDAPVRAARPSIDVLFQTASEAYGAGVLGVLLTGASADGAEGLALVKARGGRAIVQDPATAECPTMPAAALSATAVDYVLPLSKIGEYLVTLVEGTRP